MAQSNGQARRGAPLGRRLRARKCQSARRRPTRRPAPHEACLDARSSRSSGQRRPNVQARLPPRPLGSARGQRRRKRRRLCGSRHARAASTRSKRSRRAAARATSGCTCSGRPAARRVVWRSGKGRERRPREPLAARFQCGRFPRGAAQRGRTSGSERAARAGAGTLCRSKRGRGGAGPGPPCAVQRGGCPLKVARAGGSLKTQIYSNIWNSNICKLPRQQAGPAAPHTTRPGDLAPPSQPHRKRCDPLSPLTPEQSADPASTHSPRRPADVSEALQQARWGGPVHALRSCACPGWAEARAQRRGRRR